MIKIDTKHVHESSFAEHKISSVIFNQNEKKLVINVDDADLENEDGSYSYVKNIIITFTHWKQFTIQINNEQNEGLKNFPLDELESLDEILLFNVYDNRYHLCGFGKKTLAWYEWIIEDPKIEITCDSIDR